MKICFLPSQVTYEGQEAKNVLEAAATVNVSIDGNCASAGVCGKCKVKVVEGNDFNLTEAEKKVLSDEQIKAGYRLACKYVPDKDIVVEVPMSKGAAERKSKLIKLPNGFTCNNDYDEEDKAYAIAFDIGTTTVLGMLWDLKTSESLGVMAETNPQGVYGADVISRIMYAEESEENLKNIHGVIINCLNDIIDRFLDANPDIKREEIREVAAVGNTTMSHLLMGINPRALARAPFTPEFLEGKFFKAKDININAPNGDFYLMANLAGHVGSDITAGILATDIVNDGKNTLQIDIGTNGEIALAADGKVTVCSTAAGPAFEGASIYHGMRAADGAIEEVVISKEKVDIKVIGGVKPIGICGSGIIDAVAQLIEGGLVVKSGKFAKQEKLIENGYSQEVADRLRAGNGGNEFVLAYGDGGDDVVISQKDVREVQLAKAAIYAGAKVLMKSMGVTDDSLDAINIAGAFGSYIKVESALTIGLLPEVDRDKIISVGNAAGVGSSMAALSKDKLKEAENYLEDIEHIELSTYEGFQDAYVGAMKF